MSTAQGIRGASEAGTAPVEREQEPAPVRAAIDSPPLPGARDPGPWSPRLRAAVVLVEPLARSGRSLGRAVSGALLEPLVRRAAADPALRVELPLLHPSPTATDEWVSQISELGVDVMVVLELERQRERDDVRPGAFSDQDVVLPAVEVRAHFMERGATAPYLVQSSAGLASFGGASADVGLPSAVQRAAAPLVEEIVRELQRKSQELAEHGALRRIGLVAPTDQEALRAWFAKVLEAAPGAVAGSVQPLPCEAWIRVALDPRSGEDSGGNGGAPSSALAPSERAGVWSLRQKGSEAALLSHLQEALLSWARSAARAEPAASFDELSLRVETIVCEGLTLFRVSPLEPQAPQARPDATQPSATERGGERAQQDLRRAASDLARSVYLALAVMRDGSEFPIGTAWVVGRDVLATNAHVAASLSVEDWADKGFDVERFAARRAEGAGVVEFEIERVEIHPGYRALQALGLKERALAPVSLSCKAEEYLGSCDVALVHLVAGASERGLGPPFELVPDAELQALLPGTPLAYLGFPAEADVANVNVERPVPLFLRGELSAQVDETRGAAAAEHSRILRHTMSTTGGASGSPVFLGDGRVVGLHFAGSYKTVDDGEAGDGRDRIPLMGLAFAQRADVLRELLEGRAEAGLERARAHWGRVLATDASRFEVWLRRTCVVDVELDGGLVTGASVVARDWQPLIAAARLPAPAQALELPGLDFEAPGAARYLSLCLRERGAPATSEYFRGEEALARIESEARLHRFDWGELCAGFSGAIRPFHLLDERDRSERGLADGEVAGIVHLFVYRVELAP